MTKREIKPIETEYDGRRFRSRLEARWAVFFKALGWAYEYEREGFDLDGEWYLPDFYLPAFPMWVEVKPQEPSDREIELCRRLHEASSTRVLIAVGPPNPNYRQIHLFEPGRGYRPAARYALRSDRRNAGEFWLAGDEPESPNYHVFSIGPVFGPDHDRYPIIAEALKEAFKKASSERFDSGRRR